MVLRLRNFLSYRDNVPPLSFEGIHLACLSGDNGHGKSALLDAITWALWGQARAKSNDDLVYAAATDMEVEFQFLMDGTPYRVLRKQARARSTRESGRSTLELHIGSEDGFKTITGDNQTETQARINELLHMDYQTFINSAFLLQGRADEFTKKGPAERKKVLADILGLSYYEGLEARAKEETRDRELRGEELKRTLAGMEEELAQRPQVEEQLERSQQELDSLESQVKTQDAALGVLREEKKALDLKRDQVAETAREIEQARAQQHLVGAQASEHRRRILAFEQACGSRDEVEQGFGLLASARQRNDELNGKLSLLVGLEEKKARVEASVKEAGNALATQEEVLLNVLAELEAKAGALPSLESEMGKVTQRLQELQAREIEVQEKKHQALQTAAALAVLTEEKNALDFKRDQAAETARQIEQARAQQHMVGAQASEHRESIVAFEQACGSRDEVEQGFAHLASARQRADELNGKLALMLGMQEKKAQAEASVKEAGNAVATQEEVLLSVLAELEAKAGALPSLESELGKVNQRLQELQAREIEVLEKKRQALETAGQVQALKGENQKLHTEMQELRDRMDLLDQGQTCCPVCETELGETGLRTIREKYLREGQARKGEYVARQKQVQDLAVQQSRLEKEAETEEASLRKEREAAQRRLTAAENEWAQAQQASSRAALKRAELVGVQARLAGRDYAREEQQELEGLVASIAALEYQREEHAEIRRRLETLAPFEERKQRLEEASLRLPQEREALERASEAASLWLGRVQELEVKAATLSREMERYPGLVQQVQELAAQQSRLEKEAETEEASLRKEREAAQRRLTAAENEWAEAQQASSRAAPKRAELVGVQARLAGRDYAREEQQELEGLVAGIAALEYQKEEHGEIRRRLETLVPFEERKQRLEEASLRLPQEREALERASEAASLWLGRVQELEVKAATLSREIEKYPSLVQQVAQAQTTLDSLRSRLGMARQEVGACQQRLDHCRQLEGQKGNRVAELARVEGERAIYQELAGAFGRKGIQAMIIEAAIPDLEAEANALLSRMTEGRMQVKLETQRDTKKGTTAETLDIKVSDELGTRNYELFSGGEAFRINFALRVALSKLLARRAGAQLRLLVIDEGFGTQDSQGKDRLVEAINSIQDDFDKILVITHIQELKELFPVRIDVVKTVEGSTYYVN